MRQAMQLDNAPAGKPYFVVGTLNNFRAAYNPAAFVLKAESRTRSNQCRLIAEVSHHRVAPPL